MKRILSAILLAGVVLALSSCNVVLGFIKTDQLVVDGDEYELAELYFEYYGETTDGDFLFGIVLVSAGIDWDESGTDGDGEVVFALVASPSSDLADGTYSYTSASDIEAFDLGFGWVNIGADYSTMIADEIYNIVGGTITVKQLLTDDYLVQMDLELEEDGGGSETTFEAYFNGELADEYDYSDIFSSNIAPPLESRRLNVY